MIYKDASTNDVFEFRYIVTQFESEGPERLEYVNLSAIKLRGDAIDEEWKVWPEGLPIPSEVSYAFFGETSVDEDFDVPSFFETFSMIRAAKDDLKTLVGHVTDVRSNELLKIAIETIEKYGDLDENYSSIAIAALNNDEGGRGQLERIAAPE